MAAKLICLTRWLEPPALSVADSNWGIWSRGSQALIIGQVPLTVVGGGWYSSQPPPPPPPTTSYDSLYESGGEKKTSQLSLKMVSCLATLGLCFLSN
jgi:hypothetical protein